MLSRIKDDNTGEIALKLVPPEKRRPERLKGTGRRGVETKLKKEKVRKGIPYEKQCIEVKRNWKNKIIFLADVLEA